MIAVDTGHINVHEAGAIEFTEHKIITIPNHEGKMWASDLDKYLDDFIHDGNNAHCVYPGLVYITFPTELGTIYSRKELKDIYSVCQRFGIPLYIDGARLGYGLMADNLDFDLARNAIDKAMKMKQMFKERGYDFYIDSPTNQQFVIIGNEEVERLQDKVSFTHWGLIDEHHTICRFVTSWSTTDDDIKELAAFLDAKM